MTVTTSRGLVTVVNTVRISRGGSEDRLVLEAAGGCSFPLCGGGTVEEAIGNGTPSVESTVTSA